MNQRPYFFLFEEGGQGTKTNRLKEILIFLKIKMIWIYI